MRFGCICPCLKAKLALQIQGLPQISYHIMHGRRAADAKFARLPGVYRPDFHFIFYMSYSLNSLKGGYKGDYIGNYYSGLGFRV